MQIQNITHLDDNPKIVLLQYDGKNVFLGPPGTPTYKLRRCREKDATHKVNVHGEAQRDVNGELIRLDRMYSVLATDGEGEMPDHWYHCPEDLWGALQAGNYEGAYTKGEPLPDALMKKQGWWKPGVKAYKLQAFTPEIGKHLATLDDVVKHLEAKLRENAAAKLKVQDGKAPSK